MSVYVLFPYLFLLQVNIVLSMAHKEIDTESDVGLENTIRASWSAGSKVKMLSSTTNTWLTAHIVTIHKDWLYCLLEDGDTKKIDRWDASVQPFNTSANGEEDDDDDDEVTLNILY